MSMKTNSIENNVDIMDIHGQKQDLNCKTENIFCPMSKNKEDIPKVKEIFVPFYDFLQGAGKNSLNLIKNMAYLLSADDKLVENARCIGFYNKNTCETLNFLHPVVYLNILHGIKDINKFEENEDQLKTIGDYLDSIYAPLTEFLGIFERDISNYEIHLIPKEGVKEKVVKHFENVEYEVEEYIYEYVIKLYDLITEVENKSFNKVRDSIQKVQVMEAISKSCELLISKMSNNLVLNEFGFCPKIVHPEEETQEITPLKDIEDLNTSYLPHLEDKLYLGGNNLISIESESKNQTTLYTEITVVCLSCGISAMLFFVIYLVYNFFMKKREAHERLQFNDRIELVENIDTDIIE